MNFQARLIFDGLIIILSLFAKHARCSWERDDINFNTTHRTTCSGKPFILDPKVYILMNEIDKLANNVSLGDYSIAGDILISDVRISLTTTQPRLFEDGMNPRILMNYTLSSRQAIPHNTSNTGCEWTPCFRHYVGNNRATPYETIGKEPCDEKTALPMPYTETIQLQTGNTGVMVPYSTETGLFQRIVNSDENTKLSIYFSGLADCFMNSYGVDWSNKIDDKLYHLLNRAIKHANQRLKKRRTDPSGPDSTGTQTGSGIFTSASNSQPCEPGDISAQAPGSALTPEATASLTFDKRAAAAHRSQYGGQWRKPSRQQQHSQEPQVKQRRQSKQQQQQPSQLQAMKSGLQATLSAEEPLRTRETRQAQQRMWQRLVPVDQRQNVRQKQDRAVMVRHPHLPPPTQNEQRQQDQQQRQGQVQQNAKQPDNYAAADEAADKLMCIYPQVCQMIEAIDKVRDVPLSGGAAAATSAPQAGRVGSQNSDGTITIAVLGVTQFLGKRLEIAMNVSFSKSNEDCNAAALGSSEIYVAQFLIGNSRREEQIMNAGQVLLPSLQSLSRLSPGCSNSSNGVNESRDVCLQTVANIIRSYIVPRMQKASALRSLLGNLWCTD